MSSKTTKSPDDEFLKMFDALLLVESAADARDLVQNVDLVENLEFHEAESNDESEEEESP
jgi:hypothetical protein